MGRTTFSLRQTCSDRRKERSTTSALHEAAHVLVGHLLGWRLDWVKTYHPRVAGRTGFDGGVMMTPPTRAALAHRSAVRLAGEVAETLCTERHARQIRDDIGDDWAQLWAVDFSRSHISNRQKRKLISKGRGLARKLIDKNMASFLSLAAAIHQGPVTAREAVKIIERPQKGPAADVRTGARQAQSE